MDKICLNSLPVSETNFIWLEIPYRQYNWTKSNKNLLIDLSTYYFVIQPEHVIDRKKDKYFCFFSKYLNQII